MIEVIGTKKKVSVGFEPTAVELCRLLHWTTLPRYHVCCLLFYRYILLTSQFALCLYYGIFVEHVYSSYFKIGVLWEYRIHDILFLGCIVIVRVFVV